MTPEQTQQLLDSLQGINQALINIDKRLSYLPPAMECLEGIRQQLVTLDTIHDALCAIDHDLGDYGPIRNSIERHAGVVETLPSIPLSRA